MSSMLANVFLLIAIITGFIYMALGLIAHGHLKGGHEVDKGWALSPIWALFPAAYEKTGERLCKVGKYLFYISTITCIAWLAFRNL